MKKLMIIPLLILFLGLISCDRDMDFDTISKTDPGLQVVVETANGTTYTKIEGAAVKLYNDKTTYDADGSPLITKNTDSKGIVSFTAAELVKKGVFYIRVNKGALNGTGQTSYMLLNDGMTVVIVRLN